MRPADTALSHVRTHAPARRGFNLVEAAIVLGVVGLVIGGIWMAASAVQKKLRLQKEVTGIITITNNLRTLYRGQDTDTLTRIDFQPNLLEIAINGADGFRVYPTMLNSSYLRGQDGFGVNIRIQQNRIIFDRNGLSIADCINLVSFMSGTKESGPNSIGLNGTRVYKNAFPFIPTQSQCSGAVDFSFDF
jgi:hypothetical protein